MQTKDSSAARTVLITGCSSGIGKATALRLANEGYTVYATARRTETLDSLTEAGCHALALDVTDETSMQKAVAAIEERHGSIDILINNAGYSQSGAIESVDMERVRRQFETNVFGLTRLIQLVLPGMRQRGAGKIVNLSSMGGRLTLPGGGYYHASKYALEALSDALRFEVRGFGIDVILVEPGLIRTSFSDAAVSAMGTAAHGTPEGNPDDPYAAFNAAVAKATKEAYEQGPLAKLAGGPDDVAKVIAKALRARRPKARYTVTASAKLLLAQRWLLSDRMWDAFLRTQFPQPANGRVKELAGQPKADTSAVDAPAPAHE